MERKVYFSLVLLTYSRDDRILETLYACTKLVGIEEVEVILVDNNEDSIDRSDMLSAFVLKKYIKLNKNLGVAGGRNSGAIAASGEVVVFLDDDATILNLNCFWRLKEHFKIPDIGVVAFRSLNKTGDDIDSEFPHENKNRVRHLPFFTNRYIGVAHAIRKDIFCDCGLYPEEFHYGMEEFYLSFCIINDGFKIYYDPDLVVEHRHSAEGRVSSSDKWFLLLRNRLFVYWRFYPMINALGASLMWAGYVMYNSRFQVNLIEALIGARRLLNNYGRDILSGNSIQYIKDCGATLWR